MLAILGPAAFTAAPAIFPKVSLLGIFAPYLHVLPFVKAGPSESVCRGVASARAQALGADASVLAEWRWSLEEYAVQLFAQDLRTRVTISAKRLSSIEAQTTAILARH